MKRISTLIASLLLTSLFFTSCGEKEGVDPDPVDCNVVKEFLVTQGKRQLFNQYEYNETGTILKIKHEDPAGKPFETRFEYDNDGRLSKVYDKLTIGLSPTPVDGYLEYLYNPEGLLHEVHAFKTENDQKETAQVFVVYYDINTGQINQVVTSFGDRYRFEYDAKGNASKTYYKPETTPEYLLEEYNSYNDKVQDTPADKPFVLRNLFFALRGRSFSHNQVTAYKVFNEDGSLKATYNITREYNPEGKEVKEITTISSNGNTTTTTLEKDHPICK